VPYDGGEVKLLGRSHGEVAGAEASARRWAEHDGCAAQPRVEPAGGDADCTATRLTYANCTAGTSVALLKLDGGGHTWPGGSQYLPQGLVGKVCRQFDGATLIWEFFRQHPKP